MTLEEFKNCDVQNKGYVVKYKGSARIAFSKDLYQKTNQYILSVRNNLPGISTGKTSPNFVSWTGSKMDGGLGTTQFSNYWACAAGNNSGRINPTIMRKFTTTLVHHQHKVLAQETANHLCHSLSMAEKS